MDLAYFILLFCHVAALPHGKYFRTDYNYRYPEVDGWFKFHVIPANWSDAYLQCHNEGAVLASPESKEMLYAMKHIMTATATFSGVFTGIHATYSNGDYTTIEGTAFSEIEKFISWDRNQPNNRDNGEDTLMMLQDGRMVDVRSTILLPFICFRRRTHLVPTECGTTDPEYSYDARTGSCYKFHMEPNSWSRAFSTCSGEGGHLAIINSEDEAQALKDLFVNSTGPQPNFEMNVAFLGFRDIDKQGLFITVQGQTLKEAGYDRWDGYKPNYEPSTRYHCGAIRRRDGKLAATTCEYKMPFICEKNPDSLMSEDEDYIINIELLEN